MKTVSKCESVRNKKNNISVVDIVLTRVDELNDLPYVTTMSHTFNVVFSCQSDVAENTMQAIENYLAEDYDVTEVMPNPTELYFQILSLCGSDTFRSITIHIDKKYEDSVWESYIYYKDKELMRMEFSDGEYNGDFTKWILYRDGNWEFIRENYSIKWDGEQINYEFNVLPEYLNMIPSAIEENVKNCICMAKSYFKKYFEV